MTCLVRVLIYATPLLIGTYAAFRPTLDSRFERMQADMGDTLLNHYTLEHLHRCLTDRDYCGRWLSPPFYFPQTLVLAYSENFLGVLPLYSMLRAFLVEDLAYQAWMILLAMLNYLAMAMVCRWLGCPPFVAAFTAFLWAFGLPHVVHIGHQQLLARFVYPLAAYHAWRLAIAPCLRSLNRLALLIFLQLVCCIYTGWFLAFSLAFFLPAAIILHRGGCQSWIGFLRQHPGGIIATTALGLLSIGLFVSPYLHANSDLTRTYEECTYYLPTLASWFRGPEGSFWYCTFAPLREEVNRENTLFGGLALLILALGATLQVLRNWPSGRAYPLWVLTTAGLITSGLLVLLTLNLKDGISGWQLVRWLPGSGGIRVVSRVYVPVYLFLILGVAVVFSEWIARCRNPLFKAVGYLLLVLSMVEQLGSTPPSFPKANFYDEVDRLALQLRGADVAYVWQVCSAQDWEDLCREELKVTLLGMWAGLKANVPVCNGYSGRSPPSYPDGLLPAPQEVIDWLKPRYQGTLRIVEANPSGKVEEVLIRAIP